jgi:hypothetical protein
MIDGGALPATLLQHHRDFEPRWNQDGTVPSLPGLSTPERVLVLFAVAVSKNIGGRQPSTQALAA